MSKPDPDDAVREHASAICQYLQSGHSARHAEALRGELIEILGAYAPDDDITWGTLWLGDLEIFHALVKAQGDAAFEIDNFLWVATFWRNLGNIPKESGIRGLALDKMLRVNGPSDLSHHSNDLCSAFQTDDPAVIDVMMRHHSYSEETLRHVVLNNAFFTMTRETSSQKVSVLLALHKAGVDLSSATQHRSAMIFAKIGIPLRGADLGTNGNSILEQFLAHLQSNHAMLRALPLIPEPEDVFEMHDGKLETEMRGICAAITAR